MSEYIGIIGALGGAIIGAATTFLVQRSQRQSERQDRLRDERRSRYANFLAAVHELYSSISGAYRRFSESDDHVVLRRELAEASPERCQAALEEIRLSASGSTVERAEMLWRHLRGLGVPQGVKGSISDWKGEYWDLRRAFTEQARRELGLSGPIEPPRSEGE